uniref:Uncharacterized protein n=1 Tax=Oryza meridionalis TaxID=40149 RepID=A0A0E0D9Y5_9ORYZ
MSSTTLQSAAGKLRARLHSRATSAAPDDVDGELPVPSVPEGPQPRLVRRQLQLQEVEHQRVYRRLHRVPLVRRRSRPHEPTALQHRPQVHVLRVLLHRHAARCRHHRRRRRDLALAGDHDVPVRRARRRWLRRYYWWWSGLLDPRREPLAPVWSLALGGWRHSSRWRVQRRRRRWRPGRLRSLLLRRRWRWRRPRLQRKPRGVRLLLSQRRPHRRRGCLLSCRWRVLLAALVVVPGARVLLANGGGVLLGLAVGDGLPGLPDDLAHGVLLAGAAIGGGGGVAAASGLLLLGQGGGRGGHGHVLPGPVEHVVLEHLQGQARVVDDVPRRRPRRRGPHRRGGGARRVREGAGEVAERLAEADGLRDDALLLLARLGVGGGSRRGRVGEAVDAHEARDEAGRARRLGLGGRRGRLGSREGVEGRLDLDADLDVAAEQVGVEVEAVARRLEARLARRSKGRRRRRGGDDGEVGGGIGRAADAAGAWGEDEVAHDGHAARVGVGRWPPVPERRRRRRIPGRRRRRRGGAAPGEPMVSGASLHGNKLQV